MKVHMNHDVTRRYGKRLLGCMLLFSMAAAAVSAMPSHDRTQSADCHPSARHVPELSGGGAPASGCEHGLGVACATMVGCVILPSAVASADTRLQAFAGATVVTPFATGGLHGRLGLGPPTPPPNS